MAMQTGKRGLKPWKKTPTISPSVFSSASCWCCWSAFASGRHGTHDHTAHYDRYTIYFTDPVSGLGDDSVVKYKGIEVGKILDLPDRRQRTAAISIKADIEIKADTPDSMRATTATIESQGIAGHELHRTRHSCPPIPRPLKMVAEARPIRC